jgi:hypothetical protein
MSQWSDCRLQPKCAAAQHAATRALKVTRSGTIYTYYWWFMMIVPFGNENTRSYTQCLARVTHNQNRSTRILQTFPDSCRLAAVRLYSASCLRALRSLRHCTMLCAYPGSAAQNSREQRERTEAYHPDGHTYQPLCLVLTLSWASFRNHRQAEPASGACPVHVGHPAANLSTRLSLDRACTQSGLTAVEAIHMPIRSCN